MYFRLIILALGLLAHSQVLAQDNCTEIDTCEDCTLTGCQWVQCLADDPSCQRNDPAELCFLKECNSTTTTPVPTTTTTPTEAPTTTTTEDPTTTPTEAPTTPAPTEAPTTPAPTEAPTTPAPTEAPTTTTEATTTTVKPCPPCPSDRHFDAASFFGGIVLAVAILAVGYAAWRFYKSRNERNYHTL